MIARIILASFVLLPVTVSAQSNLGNHENESEQAHARVPKQIAFQNDSQWEDNRWQQTDVGPFLAGSITSGKGSTLKGIAIRVGKDGEAAVCFDTARMRMSAAWTGGFLKFEARRFGLIRPPAADGKLFCSTSPLAGWAKARRFKPEIDEITDPVIDKSYGKAGTSETRLPKDWASYRGHYTCGDRVILSYTVADTQVLESPWYVRSGKDEAFVRQLEIGPSDQTHRMLITDSKCRIDVIAQDNVHVENSGRQSVLVIEPRETSVAVDVLMTSPGGDDAALARLRSELGRKVALSMMIQEDLGRFLDTITTKGESTRQGGPYVIDTITLPFENPWNALFFTAGHDFFSTGAAAICTVHGDVWTVSGIDRDLSRLSWRRFATGLHQPLGLRIVEDKVYVIGRNQVTRLHDRNGDGEADFYENFNNDLIISPRSHDYVTCLDTDPEGNFYFIHAKTGVMKLSADGSQLTQVADGFRNPNGMGVSPDGMITAAPQQGGWTPESSLIVVKEGGYYGFGGPRITAERSTGWDLPMCFIPRAMDNSGGGQVWVEGDRWGPLAGKMLHLSYGQCQMLLALTEQAGGVIQGGTIRFPTMPNDFEAGVMRGRFSPHDGQLYVSGLRGWQTRAIRDGCFQRVRYTGGPVRLPVAVKTYTNGIKLTFSDPLDKSFAQRPENYFAQAWNYRWSKEYGSPDFSVEKPMQEGRDEVAVVSSTLGGDGRSVFLEMPGRHPVNQLQISWLLRSEAGHPFRGEYAHTINREPTESFPESLIVRQPRPRFVSPELEQRLRPGLEYAFRSSASDQVDRRVARLVALVQKIDASPTPFLPAGPFQLAVDGTLHAALSGYYSFRFEGNGHAELRINDERVIGANSTTSSETPILLFKGHNRIQISYESPRVGKAKLSLSWKGYNFDWEPVPPTALFHDSGSPELVAAQSLRHGRELFASHQCSACHQTKVGPDSMFELLLHAPDLSSAGNRFNADWLHQWLVAPQSLRPGTPMPAVLGDGPDAMADAADLVAFLLTQAGETVASDPTNGVQSVGEELYEQQACISCHHFRRPDEEDEFDRLSLYHADAKYRSGRIAEFLSDPARYHLATRMPNFRLNDDESNALAVYIRSESKGRLPKRIDRGDPARGRKLFSERGCQQCHAIEGVDASAVLARSPAMEKLSVEPSDWGCLADPNDRAAASNLPRYTLSDRQRSALRKFVRTDRASLSRSIDVEVSHRLVTRLQCANCHDRDGLPSHRGLVVAAEGSGKLPETIPQLTWSGEKMRSGWTESLLAGTVSEKSRPWLKARMPGFGAYASRLAHGLASEHGVDALAPSSPRIDPALTEIGRQLTLQSGLDCRQCHGIGDQQPRGDKDTAIALGINFSQIRDRMRHEAYKRFMLDPPRYDVKTRMVRLSTNGLTTKLKTHFDADARKQFDAVWHYIQSLPAEQ